MPFYDSVKGYFSWLFHVHNYENIKKFYFSIDGCGMSVIMSAELKIRFCVFVLNAGRYLEKKGINMSESNKEVCSICQGTGLFAIDDNNPTYLKCPRCSDQMQDKVHTYKGQVLPGQEEKVRRFASGATRDTDEGKLDYEGFLSPTVLESYAKYMHKNRVQSDGSLRNSDNWQKGIPVEQYMKSKFRHFMHTWYLSRCRPLAVEEMIESLNAELFNTMGMLFELLKESDNDTCE